MLAQHNVTGNKFERSSHDVIGRTKYDQSNQMKDLSFATTKEAFQEQNDNRDASATTPRSIIGRSLPSTEKTNKLISSRTGIKMSDSSVAVTPISFTEFPMPSTKQDSAAGTNDAFKIGKKYTENTTLETGSNITLKLDGTEVITRVENIATDNRSNSPSVNPQKSGMNSSLKSNDSRRTVSEMYENPLSYTANMSEANFRSTPDDEDLKLKPPKQHKTMGIEHLAAKAVFSKEHTLFDWLFDGYNKHIRPNGNEEGITEVFFQVSLFNILDLVSSNEKFRFYSYFIGI